MPEKPSLPISIPLNLLSEKLDTIIRKKGVRPDINKGTMAPPESVKQNRINDAQLLVAFSEEPRANVPAAPRPTDKETTKELRSFRKIAHVPEDLPTAEPDPPIPARILDLSMPGKVFCDKKVQTTNEDSESDRPSQKESDRPAQKESDRPSQKESEMLNIIQTNNITKRQLLRLARKNDVNNNNEDIIVIEDTPDEDIPEAIIAHSNRLKRLIMKNYKGQNFEQMYKKYELFSRFLTNDNINFNKEIISGQGNDNPATSNESNGEQDVDASPGSPPEIDICAGTSESTSSSTANNTTAPPATQNTPANNTTAPPATQNSTANNTTAPPATRNSTANNTTAPRATQNSTASNTTASPATHNSTANNTTAPPATQKSTINNTTAPPATHNSTAYNTTVPPATHNSTANNTTAPPATQNSMANNTTAPPATLNTPANNTAAPPAIKISTANNATSPPTTQNTPAAPILGSAAAHMMCILQGHLSEKSFTPDAARETSPDNSNAVPSRFEPQPANIHKDTVNIQQVLAILQQVINRINPDQSTYLKCQKLMTDLKEALNSTCQQGSTSKNSSTPDAQIENLPENSQAASSGLRPGPEDNHRKVPMNQASSDDQPLSAHLHQLMNPAFQQGVTLGKAITPDAQIETLPGISGVVPSSFQRPVNQAFSSVQQLAANMQQLKNPSLKRGLAARNSFTLESQSETSSENSQASSSGFRPAGYQISEDMRKVPVNQVSPDLPQLRQFMDPTFQQGNTSRNDFFPKVRQFPVNQAFSSAQHLPTNLQQPDQSASTWSGAGAYHTLQQGVDSNNKCDICGRRFRTKHGLTIHGTRIHNKSTNPDLKRKITSKNSGARRGISPENSQAAPLNYRPPPEHIRQVPVNVQQSRQLPSNLQQPGVVVANLPGRPALTYPNPALGYMPHHQQVFPNLANHQSMRMQSPVPMHPFGNMESVISTGNMAFHSNNFSPTQVCPNTTVGEGRHAFEHEGEQQVPSKPRRGWGMTTLPMSRPQLPHHYNKYQFLMNQQKIQEMEKQQFAWQTWRNKTFDRKTN